MNLSKLKKVLLTSSGLILLGIILLNIFFRSFLAYQRFDFGHDGDLYSWIVKDIIVNHHPRLIGQLTSTPGIFIGPLFYYLLIPFFLATQMSPVGVLFFASLLSVVTVISFYWIFTKLFNKTYGLVGATLQTISMVRVEHDRWVVPTITTSLWEIWYFFVVVSLARGDMSVWPILGLLVGLIWHINFSLAPVLLAVPIALLCARKLPNLKQFLLGLVALVVPSIPLFLFETRHQFSQTHSFIASLLATQGGETGLAKLLQVFSQVGGNAAALFFYPFRGSYQFREFLLIALALVVVFLVIKRVLAWQVAVTLCAWFVGIVSFFAVSSKITSEYYFSSLDTLFLFIEVAVITSLASFIKRSKLILVVLLTMLTIRSLYQLIFTTVYNGFGYPNKASVAEFIKNDMKEHHYLCASVTYITSPGFNFGFRYVFYRAKIHLNHYDAARPNYTIVMPASREQDKIQFKSGNIGVIPERNIHAGQATKTCLAQDTNQTDSFFGYTE